jgi:serine/threonine protein phosphatase 1
MSDIHGEYGLFLRLLDKIGFSDSDELFIAGDIIEKGSDSVKLAKLILSMPNAHAIKGNHEDYFIKHYNYLMKCAFGDFDKVLLGLKSMITDSGGDGELLDWDTVDGLEALPYYIEADDFVCIHAGVTLTPEGKLPPLSAVPTDELVSNRKFKNPDVIPVDSKCVFFGHTATSAVSGENKILGYKKPNSAFGDIRDFAKIHLDTCTFLSGILGCFAVDSLKAYYVKR